MKKISFTLEEQRELELKFQEYLALVQFVAGLHGYRGIQNLQLTPDRSGFLVPDPDAPKDTA